ncbi:MAG: outer membrane protein assembly factor BamD [Acidobacteria bacterium]|nr:outer membrane protein assembly factor BamD [Acidobacteriota bacterium]
MKRINAAIIITSIIMLITMISCGTQAGQEGPELGDKALFNAGLKYMEDEDWVDAISVFNTFETNFPNSVYYKQVRLKRADAMFSRNMRSVFIEAEAEYKAYITLYPTAENLDYVQKQIALCHWKRIRSIKNDQGETRRTLQELDIFLKKYPNSKYMDEVKEIYSEARNQLGRHEAYIADFYFSTNKVTAAKGRIEKALELVDSPEYRYSFLGLYLDILNAEGNGDEVRAAITKIEAELEKVSKKDMPDLSELESKIKEYKAKYKNTPESRE